MNKKYSTIIAIKITLILAAFIVVAFLGFGGFYFYMAVSQERSTYSIVAIDPVTGDVGAAGASCVPISASSLAALVPGRGVAAVQAAFIQENQNRVFDLLSRGKTANEIIKLISDDANDSEVEIRQYGVVTLLEGEIQAVGFTGKATPNWAGDQQDMRYAVSVQGNTLESEAVVSDALAAFSAIDIGSVELPDRLLRALETASAAGGDRRCNDQYGLQQTAEAAFIMVAKASQPSFTLPIGQEPSPDDPALPWLYISVIEAKGGPNPLIELRSRYDAWRAENLPSCSDCNLNSISVPSGGLPNPLIKMILNILNRIGLRRVAISFCLSSAILVGLVIALLITFFRRQRRNRSA